VEARTAAREAGSGGRGFGGADCGGKDHQNFGAAGGQGGDVSFDKVQRRAQGGGGRVNGVLKVEPPYNGFHIPHTFNPARYLQPGAPGKRRQMKGVADTEKFPQKGAGYIIQQFPVIGAHGGRSVNEQNQINRITIGALAQSRSANMKNKKQ
jgi:hypothetical protein